jgi:hypothetical protein
LKNSEIVTSSYAVLVLQNNCPRVMGFAMGKPCGNGIRIAKCIMPVRVDWIVRAELANPRGHRFPVSAEEGWDQPSD